MSENVKPDKEIDHEYTDEIVCPHCGFSHVNFSGKKSRLHSQLFKPMTVFCMLADDGWIKIPSTHHCSRCGMSTSDCTCKPLKPEKGSSAMPHKRNPIICERRAMTKLDVPEPRMVRMYGADGSYIADLEDARCCIVQISKYMGQCFYDRGHGPDGLYCERHAKVLEGDDVSENYQQDRRQGIEITQPCPRCAEYDELRALVESFVCADESETLKRHHIETDIHNWLAANPKEG